MAAAHAVSPDGALFATIVGNAVQIFDTGSGRLKSVLAQKSQASSQPGGTIAGDVRAVIEPYTSIAWGQDGQSVASASGRRRLLLAVGTAAGSVVAYDASAAEPLWRARAGPDGGAIRGLVFAHLGSGPAFVALGRQSTVVQLDAASGAVLGRWEAGEHPLAAMALSQDGSRCVLAGALVDIWDPAARARVFRFSGHAAPAKVAACTSDGTLAASASSGERTLAVWDASGPPSKKRRAAAGLLETESPVVAVEMQSQDTGAALVAAALEDGGAIVWRYEAAGQRGQVSNQFVRLRVRGAGVLAIKLDIGLDGAATLLVTRGGARPAFERVAVPAAGLPPAEVVFGSAQAPSERVSIAAPQEAGRRDVVMLGADNAGHVAHLRTTAAPAEPAGVRAPAVLGKHSRSEDSANAAGPAATSTGAEPGVGAGAADVPAPDSDGDGDAPLRTIGDQVAALPRGKDEVTRTPDAHPAAGVDAEETVTADSLTVLLSQVLHSQDRALLERCFAVSNKDVISNTVKRLSSPDAVLLLRAAVQRLQSRPLRGEQLQTWIRAVLVWHTGYLITAPGAQAAVAALFQTIQARTSWHEPLLSLSGRLELVRAQLNRRAITMEAAEAFKPMVEYFESDTDDAAVSEDSSGDMSAEDDTVSDDEPRGSDSGTGSGEDSDEDMSE